MSDRLPKDFRKLSIQERRHVLADTYQLDNEQLLGSGHADELLDLADVMVESAAGFLPLPLGIATGFIVDGVEHSIPMATEEPSVIAAATYGAKIVARGGGIATTIDDPVMTAQVFIEQANTRVAAALCSTSDPSALNELAERLKQSTDAVIPAMTERGGGYRGCDAAWLTETQLLRIQIHIDVRDAMGANVLNTVAEQLKPVITDYCGGRSLMAILTNDALQRRAQAEFRLPLHALRRKGIDSRVLAERIILAGKLAHEDPSRAVTHNKGIMNGVTAMALATGNDTRGLEAAVHRFACRDGQYRGLTSYRLDNDELVGSIELPVPLGSVGGAIGFHPVARMALNVLEVSSAGELGRIAAALGLVQNFAAVSALVAEGIQHGHMRFHAHRLAYQAGARGSIIAIAAERITAGGVFNSHSAKTIVQQLHSRDEQR